MTSGLQPAIRGGNVICTFALHFFFVFERVLKIRQNFLRVTNGLEFSAAKTYAKYAK